MARSYWWFVLLYLLLLFLGNDILELRAEEPRRAIVSLEMLLSGNWIVPQIHGWEYYNKPPFFNWVLASFYSLFGVSDWISRLPSLLAWLGLAAINFQLMKQNTNQKAALIAAITLLFGAEFLFYASTAAGEIDMLYALLVFGQLAVLFRFRVQFLAFVLFYLLGAAGMLTKGLPSVLFTAFTLFSYTLALRQWQWLKSWQHWAGLIVGLGPLPLYFWLYHQQADLVSLAAKQFWEASNKSANEADFMAIFLHFMVFPIQLLSLLMPFSLILILIRKKQALAIWQNPWLKFNLIFLMLNILIYWISPGTRNRYLYMFLPVLANVIGYVLTHGSVPSFILNRHKIISLITIAIGALAVGYFYFEVAHSPTPLLKIACISSIGLLVVGHFHSSFKGITYFLMVLLAAKCFHAFAIIPNWQDTSKQLMYEKRVNEMLELTNGQCPKFYGANVEKPYFITLLGDTLSTVVIKTPPEIAYQIPYYFSKATAQIFEFKTATEANQYYLAYAAQLPENIDHSQLLYEFEDRWKHQKLVLFKQLDSTK